VKRIPLVKTWIVFNFGYGVWVLYREGMVMRKLFFIVLCLFSMFFIMSCRSIDYLYTTMSYDSIECDGTIYYRISDSERKNPYDTTNFNIPVFIVDDKQKTRTDNIYYAAVILEDNSREYLIFDGGTFLRSDLFQ
jgi:hypothetical protein